MAQSGSWKERSYISSKEHKTKTRRVSPERSGGSGKWTVCADSEWFTTEGEARGVYTMNDTLKAPKVPAFFTGGILFKLDPVWRFIPTKRLEHQAPSLGTSQQTDTWNRSEGRRERDLTSWVEVTGGRSCSATAAREASSGVFCP